MVTPQPAAPDRDAAIPLMGSIAKHRARAQQSGVVVAAATAAAAAAAAAGAAQQHAVATAPATAVTHANAHAHAHAHAQAHAHARAAAGMVSMAHHGMHQQQRPTLPQQALHHQPHHTQPSQQHAPPLQQQQQHMSQQPQQQHALPRHMPLIPRPTSTTAAWAALPPSLRARILAHLALPDLVALRLAGLTRRDPAAAHELRAQLRARIATLDLVRRAVTTDGPCASDVQDAGGGLGGDGLGPGPGGGGGVGGGGLGHDRGGMHFVPPVAFAQLGVLSVLPAPAALAAVAAEMPCLHDLTVVPPPRGGALRRLSELPAALGRCGALQSVSLGGHDFARVPAALLRLHGLRALDLSGNARLGELPTDIGTRLPRLESIKLYDTRVTALPASLLDTVNANHERKPHDFVDPHAVGVTKTMFPPGYLERVICKSRYPRLAYNMRFILE